VRSSSGLRTGSSMYPGKHRVGREIDVNGAKHHRRAVMGFEPHARHPPLTAKDIVTGDRVQNFRWRQLVI
jgi:hypothetical protein